MSDGLFADNARATESCGDLFGVFSTFYGSACAFFHCYEQAVAFFRRFGNFVCTGNESVDKSLVADNRAVTERTFTGGLYAFAALRSSALTS